MKTAALKDREVLMRRAGKIVSELLKLMERLAVPGVATGELDRAAEEFVRSQGAEPAFKGYHGFPATICTSINEQVVHGIPGPTRLQDGDIVGVDVGVSLSGWFSDAARTFAIGEVDRQSSQLIQAARGSLEKGIAQALAGNRVSDISHAVQAHAEAAGFSVVRDYVGHGIGRALHEEPQVPNFGKPGQGPLLEEGMALAIEPMISAGTHAVELLPDGWTVVTADRKRSAHFEQTVFVGRKKAEILTE